jgi:rubrerythrin
MRTARYMIEAIRVQLDALEVALVSESGSASALEPVCVHPMDRRRDESSMGVTRWTCLECGYTHEQKNGG